MLSKQINICHTVSSLAKASGGPARTVPQLAHELSKHSTIKIQVISQQLGGSELVNFSIDRNHLLMAMTDSSLLFRSGLLIRHEIFKVCSTRMPDIIHNHGIWLPANHWPAAAARRFNVPLVLHPRGMLEPWAINHNGFKKRIAMALFQRRDIETAAVLMATSFDEYQSIRNLGFSNPVAVIPNGIVFDNNITQCSARVPCSDRTVLFLSRVHPKKGLFNLVHAWNTLKPEGWKLQIAGPDEAGHRAEVMQLVRQIGLAEQVSFIGEVDGVEKRNAYRDADLFVLPTFSENFGVVVAEALSYGVPVITTKGTPWQDLETYGCGWWIDIGVDPLVKALREAIALTDQQRREMGETGRHYVQRYNWQDIARQTSHVYEWILGRADKPDSVYLD